MMSLTDIHARLASILAGITCIKVGVDNIYTYLELLATYTAFPLLFPPSILREILKNIKSMAQHPWLTLPNDRDKDIGS